MPSRRDAARTAASWLAVSCIAQRGASVTVAELAIAAGVSERTFYRYFPTREDCLRPAMRDSQERMARSLAAQTADVPLGDALVVAFGSVAEGEHLERTRGLLPVVLDDQRFLAVWSQETAHRHPSLLAAVADRLGCATDAVEADLAAAVYLTMMQIALSTMARTGEEPAPVLERLLRTVDSPLLPRAQRPDPRSASADRSPMQRGTP